MFDDLAHKLKVWAWIAGIVGCVIANATPSGDDLKYNIESTEDEGKEDSDFWPCDWIPHPVVPDAPKESDQA